MDILSKITDAMQVVLTEIDRKENQHITVDKLSSFDVYS